MGINKNWHLANKMPYNPTKEHRAKWHIEHSKNCDCRKMTKNIKKLIEEVRNEGKL